MNLAQLRQLAAQRGCSPAEWSPLSVPTSPPLPTSELLGTPVPAYHNHGRWVVDCECGSAQVTDPDDRRVFCPFCGNGGTGLWRPVVWPKGWKAIEAGLAGEPAEARNWTPPA